MRMHAIYASCPGALQAYLRVAGKRPCVQRRGLDRSWRRLVQTRNALACAHVSWPALCPGETYKHPLPPRALGVRPSAATYGNRALAHLRAGDAGAAEADAGAALRLDALFLKAWQRRAAARRALGRPLAAGAAREVALRCALCMPYPSLCLCLPLNGSRRQPRGGPQCAA